MAEPLNQALAMLSQWETSPASDVHTTYIGVEKVGGVPTGQPAVVALVDTKKSSDEVAAQGLLPIPRALVVNGHEVRVDVQEQPRPFDGAPFQIQLLYTDAPSAFAANDHQQCFGPTIPGGVQISPQGANWVGTLGLPWKWLDSEGVEHYGFITNRHVAGLENKEGHLMGQPHGATQPIGSLWHVAKLDRVNPNTLDLALYDSKVDGRHRVARGKVFGIDSIAPGAVDFGLNDSAVKSGRTTSVTLGRCVGKMAQTTINYGQNMNLRFKGLDIFERQDGGEFSQAGDSGSAILRVSASGKSFGSLLFAGGGNKTLGIPVSAVVEAIGGECFV